MTTKYKVPKMRMGMKYDNYLRSLVQSFEDHVNSQLDHFNLRWYPILEGTYTYEQALIKAEDLGRRIPTQDEVYSAINQGVPGMLGDFENKQFWTSTEDLDFTDKIVCFDGTTFKKSINSKDSLNSLWLVQE